VRPEVTGDERDILYSPCQAFFIMM
jgi:hypothetical protein